MDADRWMVVNNILNNQKQLQKKKTNELKGKKKLL